MRGYWRYKQPQADLKKRDIDLLVMPYPGISHIYGHHLVDDLTAQDEYYPGYTEMLLTFMENDIEVVDCLDEFRAAAAVEAPIIWPNDAHAASMGRKISAAKLAERLQRYDFVRAGAANAAATTYKDISWTGAKWGWSQYFINGGIAKDKQTDSYLPVDGAPDIANAIATRSMQRPAIVFPNAQPDHENPRRHLGSAQPGLHGTGFGSRRRQSATYAGVWPRTTKLCFGCLGGGAALGIKKLEWL